MESELIYLYSALIGSMVLAPILTGNFFLKRSSLYRYAHSFSLLTVLIGIFYDLNFLLIIWPIFNFLGVFLHLKGEIRNLKSLQTIATFIPFIFSLIGSAWLVAGANDLFLLGYNKHWSFYASLHSHFLGWIYLGCLAYLSKVKTSQESYYTFGCYLSFILFLMVALGIDGIPYIKGAGVIGLSALVPFFILLHFLSTSCKLSKVLSFLSLSAVVYSMFLALQNEFWAVTPEYFLGVRSMVSIHGMLNGFIVIPLFYFAIRLDGSVKK